MPEDWFREHDVHVHVPAGAIPKDGPSAGITMATALASLITGRPVRADTAMTGEITLTGQVLPIGGLKEKALAAQRAGITRVIAPKLNEPDVEDFPEHLRKDIEFVFVDTIDEVLDVALKCPSKNRLRGRRRCWSAAASPARAWRRGPVPLAVVGKVPLDNGPEESHGSKEEGRDGGSRRVCRRQGGEEQPLRPPAHRRR